jgi:surface protein
MAKKKAQRQKKHLALTLSLVGKMVEINRKGLLVLVFTVIATLEKALAVTNINDSNFHSAIETCLGTNPVDGLCSSSEYGSMPDWDVSLVTDMRGWNGASAGFHGKSTFNGNITEWDTGKVTDMDSMFASASAFNQDIGNWNTVQVTTMHAMFHDTHAFNQDIGSWNTGKVTTMHAMFHSASAFNQDIRNWNTSQVTYMGYMFYDATSFNQDIGSWNTEKVTYMGYMFYGATSFNHEYCPFASSGITLDALICLTSAIIVALVLA